MKFKYLIINILLFLFIQNIYSQENLLLPYRIKNKWGYSDTLGKIIINPIYDSVGLFDQYNYLNRNIANVYQKNKIGLINSSNKLITPIIWDNISLVYTDFKEQYIDAIIVSKNNKYGVINYKNQIVIPIIYDELAIHNIYENSNQFFTVAKGYNYIGKIDDKHYYINPNGTKKQISKVEYSNEYGSGIGLMRAPFDDENNNDYIINEVQKNIKNIISKNKDIIDSIAMIPFIKDEITFKVFFKGKIGLVNGSELLKDKIEKLLNPIYDSIIEHQSTFPKYIFIVKKDSTLSVVNHDGKIFYSVTCDKIFNWTKYSAHTELNGKYGFLNIEEKIEIKPEYEEMLKGNRYPYNKYFFVKLHGKYGFINRNNFQYFKD